MHFKNLNDSITESTFRRFSVALHEYNNFILLDEFGDLLLNFRVPDGYLSQDKPRGMKTTAGLTEQNISHDSKHFDVQEIILTEKNKTNGKFKFKRLQTESD
jgi:hypothetical protein